MGQKIISYIKKRNLLSKIINNVKIKKKTRGGNSNEET